MIDSTPHLLLGDTAGSASASPYGGGGRRAVMPEPASNPAIGQSPASPYGPGFTEPLVRRATPARSPSAPALLDPIALFTPVPAPSPLRPETDEDARLEVPSPYESSPTELSPTEPSPTELSPTELSPTEPEPMEPEQSKLDEPAEEPAADQDEIEPEPLRALVDVDETEAEPLRAMVHEVGDEDEDEDETESGSEPLRAFDDADETEPESLPAMDDPDETEVDAAVAEPVERVTELSRAMAIPMIQRSPEPSVNHAMSAAQAYTAPIDPSMWFIGPMEESQAPPFVRVRRQGPERVERGLWLAAIPIVIGWVLSAALFHLGHIPSIVALAMAPAGALLYGKGAGSRPHVGAVRLVGLLVVGVLLAWPISLATELAFYYKDTTGATSGVIGYVVSGMFSPSLFMAKLKELLLVALFGLGGVVAVVQTMVATRRRRRSEAS